MQLVTDDCYLRLIRDALATAILPELQSPAARATGEIIQTVIGELLKRAQGLPLQLDDEIVEGTAIAATLSGLLQRTGARPALDAIAPEAHAIVDRFQVHAELSRRVARLSAELSEQRSPARTAEDDAAISKVLRRAAEWELHWYRRPFERATAAATAAGTAGADHNGRIGRAGLESFIRQHHPDGAAISVTAFDAIPGGFGKQTSRFTLRDAQGGERELIVRKSDRAPMVLKGAFVIAHEYALVEAVSATGYPAPKPLWLGRGVPGVDADFYVMEKLPGRVPGTFLGGLDSGVGEALLLDMAVRLAELHAIPLPTFADYIQRYDDAELLAPGAAGSIESCYRRAIDAWSRYEQQLEHLPSPYFSHLRDWLLRHIPRDPRRAVLVHGDFNIHNLLVEGERVSGVLDWECALFGAPEQDLAYIQPHISRHISWERFIARYCEASAALGSPREIDSASLPFYLAFSMMRLHFGMSRGIFNLQTGANRDIRYALIELGFAPQMMELALACTATAP